MPPNRIRAVLQNFELGSDCLVFFEELGFKLPGNHSFFSDKTLFSINQYQPSIVLLRFICSDFHKAILEFNGA